MRFTEAIATSENLGDDWIKAAGHERSRSKKCRSFLQGVNEAIAPVYKARVSSVAVGVKAYKEIIMFLFVLLIEIQNTCRCRIRFECIFFLSSEVG